MSKTEIRDDCSSFSSISGSSSASDLNPVLSMCVGANVPCFLPLDRSSTAPGFKVGSSSFEIFSDDDPLFIPLFNAFLPSRSNLSGRIMLAEDENVRCIVLSKLRPPGPRCLVIVGVLVA